MRNAQFGEAVTEEVPDPALVRWRDVGSDHADRGRVRAERDGMGP